MKRINFLLAGILIISCTKQSDQIRVYSYSDDEANAPCKVTTYSPDPTSFPRTVTDDYGLKGCKADDGRIITGKVVTTIKADESKVPIGTHIKHIEYMPGYSVDKVGITGYSDVYLAEPISEYRSYKITGRTVSINLDTSVSTVIRTTLKQQYAQGMFRITEDTHGYEILDRDTIATIKTETDRHNVVIKSDDCAWRQSGSIKVHLTTHGIIQEQVINYGTGECDKEIKVITKGHIEYATLPYQIYNFYF